MVATRNDQFVLGGDTGFQGRVQTSLIAACVAIAAEGWTVAFHRERSSFAQQVLTGGPVQASLVAAFSSSVATDPNVIADATQGGTVPLTAANRAAQAALVTDAHIDTAVAAQFNDYIREPSG